MSPTESTSTERNKARWFIGHSGNPIGPYRFETLQRLIDRGKLRPDDLVWTDGMAGWRQTDSVDGLRFDRPAVLIAPSGSLSTVDNGVGTDAPRRSDSKAGYVRRHWRGDLSLPVSYWVNVVVFGWAIAAAIYLAGMTPIVQRLGETGSGFWMLSVLIVSFSVAVWSLVGAWRSSELHVSRGGSRGWATAAQAFLVIGALQFAAYVAKDTPRFSQAVRLIGNKSNVQPFELHVVNQAQEVEIAGGMSTGTADSLKTILDATPSIRVVQLNNYGGWMTEGSEVAKLIKDRGLATFTARECDSACLLAFLSGKDRYLGTNAKLGFHQASVAGDADETGNDLFREAFANAGIPDAFINRALATAPADMWYPSSVELLGAHVITAVVNDRDYRMTGINAWRQRSQVEVEFTKTPVYAALKVADPEDYTALERSYLDGVQSGVPQGEMSARLRSDFTAKIIPKFMKIGPDEELVAYWRTQLREAQALRLRDVAYCRGFFQPSPSITMPDIADVVPTEITSQDLVDLTALIQAAGQFPATVPQERDVDKSLALAARMSEKRQPGSVAVVTDPSKHLNDSEAVCNSFMAFYESVVALPPHQGGPLLRFLLNSG